ncbi:histidine kinase [Ectothiorhodospira haloalkaliphila]|uniref:Sensory histidine kinase/phosphatase NtrB n=1 Tax=Ectothiorhodospira haloalkaliphila TaxID=421628 RepID=W8KMS4_9GAMM|nr:MULTISPECIES: nitrogen regulation protein NR(II) [Ectothiorhodospira]AHK80473.1 histidine kinase [Ectothiorhodospira haloalkaliphila]MCG5494297.1 nitrogen regulation protein NR(II) [Ectothiorhodospira variabilis]MCG5496462.1 nitrogen regulation protein NR(II) [Ectothiorhodospira variabilis]MCG5504064.1 nitrogen regulation protein NR(II) [Ectothiorhodospira variabilis]MCG5507219.1 nitrogen regulation protein NR(II) [Ectothiorhodospira variabilis]
MPQDHTLHRHLLENLTTAILVADERLRLHFMNPAAEMLMEISLNRVRGLPMGDLFREDETLLVSLQQSLNTGHPFTERERLLALHFEREVTVDITVSPISEPGSPRRLLIELVQVDRQLRITREEQLLNQQSASRALLRGLAHEIKNPLGGLRGAAQLLERELPDPELQEYTRIIIGEADRLQNLVNRMLGPNNLPQRQHQNIHKALEHVRNLVSVEAPEGVLICTDYDPSIPDVNADQDMLIQSILNIVRNAVQAVGEEGVVRLRSRVLRQYTIGQVRHKLVALIQVIDHGPGISEEVRERIFFPMVSGRDGGTGLGLSIAQSLINQHGGLIECTSRPGQTVFSLLLPVELKDD